jgi:hypothetical protein
VARVDGVQELLPYVGGKPLLRSGPAACHGAVALELAALAAAASHIRLRRCAVRRVRAATLRIWIDVVPNLTELLQGSRRFG